MAEASARGLIDFSKARLTDPSWIRQVRCVMQSLGILRRRELFRDLHRNACATLAIAKLTPDALKPIDETRQDYLGKLFEAYTPWEKHDREKQDRQEAKFFRESWQRNFGNLDDPDVVQRIDAFARAMLARGADTAKHTEMARGSTIFNKHTAGGLS